MRKLILTHNNQKNQFGFFNLQNFSFTFITLLMGLHGDTLKAQCQLNAQKIKGTVYEDVNRNGMRDASELGIPQVPVKAYNSANQLAAQTFSGNDGAYELSNLSDQQLYRIEVGKVQHYQYSVMGSQGAQDIRIVQGPACDVHFGLINAQPNCLPQQAVLYTTCFVKSGGDASAPTLVGMPFNFNQNTMPSKLAMQNQTGSVWGLAWNKSTQQLFSSAFVKYGAALGAGGTGGIYVTDPSSATTQLWLDLNAMGIDCGSVTHSDPLDCGYSDGVGKSGLGDIDISSDDKMLYVTNLNNRSLVMIPMDHPDASNVMEIKIPDPGCSNGDYVVGAVEYHDGMVYLGVTCTAESSQQKSDFYFHIYSFNPVSKVFNIIFSTSFAREKWLSQPGGQRPVSQWLTSLSFINNDFMVMGITDRTGHTYCDPYYPLTGEYGDILMLWRNGNNWLLENKGVAGGRTGNGVNHFEGPGGGEFFGDDFWVVGPGLHPEISFGSVVVLPGTEEVVSTCFDPIYDSFSGGFHKYSTLNGKRLSSIQLYNKESSLYGKSAGLGDLAIGCPRLPIEIGNYVWLDDNENGIQDPNELPVKNLQLVLLDRNCNAVATTTTDNYGYYVFNHTNVDTDFNGTPDGIRSFEDYYLVVNDLRYNTSKGILIMGTDTIQLTASKLDPAVTLINSDAAVWSNSSCALYKQMPVVKIHTGSSGQNDYSFDIGFVRTKPTVTPPPPPDVKVYDLALVKKIDGVNPVKNGDLMTFQIEVYNQGNQRISKFELTDYLESYFEFDPTLNPKWSLNQDKVVYAGNEGINPAQVLSIPITLKIKSNLRPEQIINTAEISGMWNDQNLPLADADSTPDQIKDNDKGGVPNSNSDNIINNNTIDEDDHDRESLPVADLALRNVRIGNMPVRRNELVTFRMEIFNQGNIPVYNIDIVNYITSNYAFDPAANNGWTLNGNKLYANLNTALLPGNSISLDLNLRLIQQDPSLLHNVAEIYSMHNVNGVSIKDYDSTPDNNPSNDAGGILSTSTDDLLTGDGIQDEDDSDPATVPVHDLALILTTDQNLPVKKNQDILFHVTVCNQGNVAVKDPGIVLYVPSGLTLSSNDHHGWFTMGGLLRSTLFVEIAPGACVTKDVLMTVRKEATSDGLLAVAEITNAYDLTGQDISAKDWDSTPDLSAINDAGGAVGTSTDNIFTGDGIIDEDDSDPVALHLMDLALIKTYTNGTSLKYNGSAQFEITVYNQGNVSVRNVLISDYIPKGFTLSNQSVQLGWAQSGNLIQFELKNTLPPNGSAKVILVMNHTGVIEPSELINRAEISKVFDVNLQDLSAYDFDSTPDEIPGNDAGGIPNSPTDNVVNLDESIDEDDADPAGIPVFDLALTKKLVESKLVYRKGDTVEYNIEVINQGNVIARDIELVDYLHTDYIFDPSINPNWSPLADRQVKTKLNTSLQPGERTIVSIFLIFKELNKGASVPNFAEIIFARDNVGNVGEDFDSVMDAIKDNDKGGQPGTAEDNLLSDHGEIDEDDHDGADSNPVNFDLALIKEIDQNIVNRNQLLTFNIRVYNQGLLPATDIELVDYIPQGLILEDVNWTMGSSVNGISKAYFRMNEQNGKLPVGGLKSGDSLSATIKLRVDPSQPAGILVNRAEIFRATNKGNIIDDDSHADDDYLNDPGGVVFNDSDGSSANPDPLASPEDEDDADPAGIIIVDLERTAPCTCLDNATTSDNGQFWEELSFRSISNDLWFIYEVDGLYDAGSMPPPNLPTPFNTGPVGEILTELPLGDGTSIYTLQGIHVDGKGFSIILSNQYGVKLNTGYHTCYYNDPKLLQAAYSVCSGTESKYEVQKIDGATYQWTLGSGGNIISDPTSHAIIVKWTGAVNTVHNLSVDVNSLDSCYNPLEMEVRIGNVSGPVSCIGSVQVSLNHDCEVQVTPSMLLLGGPYDLNSHAVMVFNKDGSLIPNNILKYEHVGKPLVAKVINVCSGNSCWTTLNVEDKIKPQIICLNDTIECTLMKSYLKPFISDNCDVDPDRILVDETIENTPCNDLYSKIVTRTYRAKDESGNYSQDCKMNIFLKRINLDSIVFPDSLIVPKGNALLCGEFAEDSLGRPLPSVSGVPYYRGLPAWPNRDKYCDFVSSYEDFELYKGNDCIRKIRRNWKFTIWYCNTFEQRSYVQVIEIIDNKPPVIECPYSFTATTDGYSCRANVWIPMPKVFDSCGSVLRVDLAYPGGLIKDFRAQYVSLEHGYNKMTFYAYDLCYNLSSCPFYVDVVDQTPPVALCDRETVVALDRFGEVWVPAAVFNDGSYDDCHIKSMEVRRMNSQPECTPNDTIYRDSIHFCCSDLDQEVMVMFKVTDHDGNANTCMVRVEVQDKTIPHIYCPHDVTVTCYEHVDTADLSRFGFPRVSDNCNTTYTERVESNINKCRVGYIDRIFTAGNGNGIDVCTQRIWVQNPEPFNGEDITWPYDYETSGCDIDSLLPERLGQHFGFPVIDEDICDLVGISYEDHTFRILNGADACYKIIRRWKVVNWCEYIEPLIDLPTIYTHDQILKIHNKVAPTILTGCKDSTFTIIDTSCAGGNAYLVATADDDCTPNNELIWEYHVDLNRDGLYEYSDVGVGDRIDASRFYPLGKHTIKYVFEDRCGNKSVCTANFEIINCKPPVAYCKVGLSTSLVPMDVNGNGSVDDEFVVIWAKDFDNGSYHPCGYPVTFSFGKDTTNKSVKYDCDSLGRRTVTICVTASNGKQDCCNTYIDVQDNNNVSFCGCVHFPPNVTISDCSQNVDPVVINSRPSIGNCTGCIHKGTSYTDSTVFNVPNACFAVRRTWKVVFDCPGEPNRTFDRTQEIIVTTDLKPTDIKWPSDSVIVDNCRGSIDTVDVGEVPRFCVHNGNIMLMYTDHEIRREANCIFYERNWNVFSKCVPSQSYSFRQVLKVIEGAGIRYILPPDITVTDCHASLQPGQLNGFPKTNCPCANFQHTFKDSVVTNQPNTCTVIYRKWTSVFNCPPDVNGTFSGTQKVTLRITLKQSDIKWPEDSVLVDNCRGSIDTSIIGNTPMLLQDFCGRVSIRFTDQTISQNDTCRIVHRRWFVKNECSAVPNLEEFSFLQVLKVTKPGGPKVDFPDDITVTDCKKVLLPDSLNGYPKLNCPCNVFTHTYQDSVVLTEPNTCYVIYRKWTSVYNCPPEVSGTFKGTQKITIKINLNPADIMWPKDTVIVNNCPGSTDTAIINNVPKLKKDYCGYVSFRYSDQTLSNQGDTCRFIRRTWIASNDCTDPPSKQEFSFNQILKVTNPVKPRVTIPPDLTITDCKKNLSPDSLNGYPKALCVCDSIRYSYKDDTIYTNPEVCFTIERNWAIRFICKPKYDSTFFYIQRITLNVDLNPNDITWPPPSFTSFTCTPTLDPKITGQPSLKKDYCGLVTFTYSDVPGTSGVCKGIVRTWTAINACSQSQRPQFVQLIELKNQDPPSITCPKDTVVNADGNTCGKALVLPNPGLNNNCNTGVTFTNNAPAIFPVGMTFVIFTAKDSCNHTSTCTTKVTVIENVPPDITCPANITISCGEDTQNLNKYGTASATDNCPGVTIAETVVRAQDVCGIGTIDRKFVATDASGNKDSCTQRITVLNLDPLDDADIIWPPSPITVGECEIFDPSVTGEPEFDSTGISCLKASISFVDTNLCKIRVDCEWERTWTVYDTCSNRTFTFVQTIIIDDQNAPNILGVKDTTVYANDTSCNNFINLKAFVDNCDSLNIQIFNDSPYGANDFEDASGLYPPGTTKVTFTAVDGCCNTSMKMVNITVVDTIAPEFTCRKVVKKIKDDGCAVFNSQEFILKVDDNCTDSAFIKTSFNINDFTDTIRIICCDSITNYEYTTPVKVYFMDQAGNMDSCCTLLQAVDQDTICGPTLLAHVKGFVRSRREASMPGVEVMLNAGAAGMAPTGLDGYYGFYNMPNGGRYTLSAEHDINPLNGVSTADIIHIQRHILGIAPFNDPLKYVAADVNSNKKVTTADVVEIRRLILGKTDRFVNSPSWKFILDGYQFKDPEDPLNELYPQDYLIQKLDKNYYVDFTGVKMGDVDDSNNPAGYQNGFSVRNGNAVLVSTQDRILQAGQEMDIEFIIPEFVKLEGLQVGLQVNPYLGELMGLVFDEKGFVNEENSHVLKAKNSIRISYVTQPKYLKEGKFIIRVRAFSTAKISELIGLEGISFTSEAYLKTDEVNELRLEFLEKDATEGGLSVFQNIPNPFSQSTIIPFTTDEEADILLRVVDLNGQIVFEKRSSYHRGYHEIEIKRSQLRKGGIYYYQLQTSKQQVFKRMILID